MAFGRDGASELDAKTLFPALPDPVIASAVGLLKAASHAKLRITTAESCTGGLLGSLLTDIEGASGAFERGFISYSNESKCELLGLRKDLIDANGPVSEPVARAMAEGALRHSNADVAIAVTGFAGPAGPDDEPGLVHFGCAGDGIETQHREEHFGDIGRGPTRIECLRVSLEMAQEMIERIAERQPSSAGTTQ